MSGSLPSIRQVFLQQFDNFLGRLAMRAMAKAFGSTMRQSRDFPVLVKEFISNSSEDAYCPFLGRVVRKRVPKRKSWKEYLLSERAVYALAFGQLTEPAKPDGQVNFYRSWHVDKGRGRWRRIDAPRDCLKAIQERILSQLLEPSLANLKGHVVCRPGFRAMDGASAHAGSRFLVGMDVKDFYPSMKTSLVIEAIKGLPRPARWAMAMSAIVSGSSFPTCQMPSGGIPAAMLAKFSQSLSLRCNGQCGKDVGHRDGAGHCMKLACWFNAWLSLPENRFLSHWEAVLLGRLLTWRGSLPQGAPSSPAMANLAFGKFDKRIIEGLGPRFTYTRYMDDLSISITAKDAKVQMIGDASALRRFALGVVNGALRSSEFRLNIAKTTATEAGPAGSGKVHTVTGYRVGAGLIDLPRETKRFFRGLAGRIRKAGGRLDVLAKGQCAKGIRRIANVGWIGGKESRECDDGHENSKELESLALLNRLYPKLKQARSSNQLRETMSRIWKGEWVAVRKDPDSVDVLDSSGNKVETLVADVAPAFFLLDKESALACASFHSWLSGQVGRLAVPEEHQGMAPGITRLWNEFRPLLGSLVVGGPVAASQP